MSMATIFRIRNKYHVKVIAEDHRPAHVHVIGGGGEAKFRIDPVECYYVRGFSERMVRLFQKDIEKHQLELLEAWNEINED